MNLVTWTLGVELFCSLLLPFTHYLRVRLPASGIWLLLAICVFLIFLGKWFLIMGWVELEGSFNWSILGYLFLFYLGYLLPILGPRCFGRFKSKPRVTTIVIFVLTTVWLSAERWPDTHRFAAGAAVWGFLGLMLYGSDLRLFEVLDSYWARHLGKISYSFYLLHDLVLIVIARCVAHWIFGGSIPASPLLANFALTIGSVFAAVILASLTHRYIELPGVRCGKFISQLLRARLAGPIPSVQSISASR